MMIFFKRSALRIEEVQSMACTYPDSTMPVLVDGSYRIVGDAKGVFGIIQEVSERITFWQEEV